MFTKNMLSYREFRNPKNLYIEMIKTNLVMLIGQVILIFKAIVDNWDCCGRNTHIMN